MDNLKNSTAFITGGASGIGLGMAQAFMEEGVRVVIADWNEMALSQAVTTLGGSPGNVLPIRLDVTDRAAWSQVAQRVERELGPVDILCNNAGIISESRPMPDITPEGWDRLLTIKLFGTFNGVRTFVPGMKARKRGHVVNTSSIAGLIAVANCTDYTTAMFGIVGMTESLHAELASFGVGASVLCPGNTHSNLVDNRRDVVVANMGEEGAVALDNFIKGGLDPLKLGRHVVRAIRNNDLHIITHPEYRELIEARLSCVRRAIGEPADPSYRDKEESIKYMASNNAYGAK